MIDSEMAVEMANIRVSDLWSNKPAIILQGTKNPLITGRHVDDLPASAEDYEFLHEHDRLNLTHSEVRGMIDSIMVRYGENTVRRLTDKVFQVSMETFLNTDVKEATKRILIPIYRAVEHVFKQAVNPDAADNAVSPELDSHTKSQRFAQSIVAFLRDNPTFPSPITELVKKQTEITFMDEIKFHDPYIIVRKENKETTPPSALTGRALASSSTFKHDQRK